MHLGQPILDINKVTKQGSRRYSVGTMQQLSPQAQIFVTVQL
jgi:hypothetical protein